MIGKGPGDRSSRELEMGLIDKILGAPVVGAAQGIAGIIDRFVETPEEKQAAEIVKLKLMAEPSRLQVELNQIEAQSRSLFVAGWRPFVGWVCGFALMYEYVLEDVLAWGFALWAPEVTPPNIEGSDELVTILVAMLGMAGIRTLEKTQGRTK